MRAPWEMLICLEQRLCRSWGAAETSCWPLPAGSGELSKDERTPFPLCLIFSGPEERQFPGTPSWERWGGTGSTGGTRPVPDVPLAPGNASLP